MTTMKRSRTPWLCVVTVALSFGFVWQAAAFTPAIRPTGAAPVVGLRSSSARELAARALPTDVPVCTSAQSRSLQGADAGQPPGGATSRPDRWFAANECAPPTVTQIPRAPDERQDLGTIIGPGNDQFRVVRTSHMIWNGIPGSVSLRPDEKQRYQQAATVAATRLVSCCTTNKGPAYSDNRWHCSAWMFKNDFYSFPTNTISWSISSYLAYCAIAVSMFGGVVEGNAGGLPYNRAPSHWASCTAYNSTNVSLGPDLRGCWGAMGSLGFYRRWYSGDPSDTSSMSGYSIGHQQVVTDVYNPFLEDQCFLGQISSEFHIHANHVVSWEADLVNTPAGVQWCPWHIRSSS